MFIENEKDVRTQLALCKKCRLALQGPQPLCFLDGWFFWSQRQT